MLARPSIVLTALTLLAPLAHAQSRHETLSGASLVIDSPCARSVTIQPDAPAGQIRLDATAAHQEEIAQLVFTAADSPRLTVEHDCWKPALSFNFRPTLQVTLHVPSGIPLNIDESGPADYRIGDLAGPLTLDLSGPVHFSSGRITGLQADLSGPADVHIAAIDGKIHSELSGPGSLEIGAAHTPDATMEVSGVGGVHVASGSIGDLNVDSSGMAAIRVGATVTNAHVELSGVGGVTLARVTGTLTKDVSGVGEVSVGNR
jgi:hypothetical protein